MVTRHRSIFLIQPGFVAVLIFAGNAARSFSAPSSVMRFLSLTNSEAVTTFSDVSKPHTSDVPVGLVKRELATAAWRNVLVRALRRAGRLREPRGGRRYDSEDEDKANGEESTELVTREGQRAGEGVESTTERNAPGRRSLHTEYLHTEDSTLPLVRSFFKAVKEVQKES